MIVYFKDDKVASFDRDNVPQAAPQAPDQGAPIEKFPQDLARAARRSRATRSRRRSRGSRLSGR